MQVNNIEKIDEVNDGVAFAVFAGQDEKKWRALEGIQVNHKNLGSGLVRRMEGDMDSGILFEVEFSHLPAEEKSKRFNPEGFLRGFFPTVRVDNRIPEWPSLKQAILNAIIAEKGRLDEIKREEKKKKEDEALFSALRKKYSVDGYSDKTITSRLFVILLKLEDCEELSEEEIQWLTDRTLFAAIAANYENQANRQAETSWHVAKASSFWRKIGNAPRALAVTEGRKSDDPKLDAAIKTSRGGAMRDLGRLTEAKILAGEAIKLTPRSYYAYSLMGAILFQEGDPVEGLSYFEAALSLGSTPRETQNHMKSSVERADRNEQVAVAKYLLEKDPKQFFWARQYLPKGG